MPRLHALELVPDAEGQAAVREVWQRLLEVRLPSQALHTKPSNAPHVSLVEAPALPEAALDVARVRLGSLLPVTGRVGGVTVLGGARVTLALAVTLDDDVVRRALAVRVQVPERAHHGWLPHVTLARRLDRTDVPRALEVVGTPDLDLVFTEIRRWDPAHADVTTVARASRRSTLARVLEDLGFDR